MPSGTEKAKQMFKRGVEKTRSAAEPGSSFGTQGDSLGTKKADNPKRGWFTSHLAKGDTGSSRYDPAKYHGSSAG